MASLRERLEQPQPGLPVLLATSLGLREKELDLQRVGS